MSILLYKWSLNVLYNIKHLRHGSTSKIDRQTETTYKVKCFQTIDVAREIKSLQISKIFKFDYIKIID